MPVWTRCQAPASDSVVLVSPEMISSQVYEHVLRQRVVARRARSDGGWHSDRATADQALPEPPVGLDHSVKPNSLDLNVNRPGACELHHLGELGQTAPARQDHRAFEGQPSRADGKRAAAPPDVDDVSPD